MIKEGHMTTPFLNALMLYYYTGTERDKPGMIFKCTVFPMDVFSIARYGIKWVFIPSLPGIARAEGAGAIQGRERDENPLRSVAEL